MYELSAVITAPGPAPCAESRTRGSAEGGQSKSGGSEESAASQWRHGVSSYVVSSFRA